jgi:hypothetical protein
MSVTYLLITVLTKNNLASYDHERKSLKLQLDLTTFLCFHCWHFTSIKSSNPVTAVTYSHFSIYAVGVFLKKYVNEEVIFRNRLVCHVVNNTDIYSYNMFI